MKRILLILLLSSITVISFGQTVITKGRLSDQSSYINTYVNKSDTGIMVHIQNPSSASIIVDTTSSHYTNLQLSTINTSLGTINTNITNTQATNTVFGSSSSNITTGAQALASVTTKKVAITVDYAYNGTVYIGSSGVTVSTGTPLKGGDVFNVDINDPSQIYYIGTESLSNGLRITWTR